MQINGTENVREREREGPTKDPENERKFVVHHDEHRVRPQWRWQLFITKPANIQAGGQRNNNETADLSGLVQNKPVGTDETDTRPFRKTVRC